MDFAIRVFKLIKQRVRCLKAANYVPVETRFFGENELNWINLDSSVQATEITEGTENMAICQVLWVHQNDNGKF